MIPDALSPVEIRVVGSLIEKELSTPDHYPLSLNALVAACNQSSNRDPVMRLDEGTVGAAVESLRRKNVVRQFQASGSRVPKYRHLLAEDGELSRAELAALCVLMLRGAQTMAEIKSRAARLMPGDSSEGVEGAVEKLSVVAPIPAVVRMERRPGQKESRYMHQLGGMISLDDEPVPTSTDMHAGDRITELEARISELESSISQLQSQFAEFRKQFE